MSRQEKKCIQIVVPLHMAMVERAHNLGGVQITVLLRKLLAFSLLPQNLEAFNRFATGPESV